MLHDLGIGDTSSSNVILYSLLFWIEISETFHFNTSNLDFIEFCVNYDDNEYTHLFNDFLKSEMSAYRFVDGNLVEINSKEEIKGICFLIF